MATLDPRPARRPPRWMAWLCVSVFVLNYASSILGDLVWASLLDSRPELIIALNPRNRYLTLVAPVLGPVAYYGIGFVRLIIGDPASFFLGYWYGDKALDWVRRRSRTYGPIVDDGVALFGRLAYPIVFFAPNSYICVIAGASGMRPLVFVALNVAGTIVRLVAIRAFGLAFGSQIGSITDFVGEYRIPILAVSAVVVGITLFREFRGGDSELAMVRDLTGDDLEAHEASTVSDGVAPGGATEADVAEGDAAGGTDQG